MTIFLNIKSLSRFYKICPELSFTIEISGGRDELANNGNPLLHWVQRLYNTFFQQRKIKEFEKDFPVFLMSLASTIRAGIEPYSALKKVKDLFPVGSAIEEELGLLLKSYHSENCVAKKDGYIFGQEVYGNIEKISPEITLFKSAFDSSSKEGGSLAPSLFRIAKVVRQRQTFKRKVRGALALQKASGIGIGVSAAAILSIQYIANPESINLALSNFSGRIALIFGSLLIFIGTLKLILLSKRDLL